MNPAQLQRAKQATGALIAKHDDWTHWLTLTLDDVRDEDDAMRAFRTWLRKVTRMFANRRHVPVAFGRERSPTSGTVHFHVLIALRHHPDPRIVDLYGSDPAPDHLKTTTYVDSSGRKRKTLPPMVALWRRSHRRAGKHHRISTYQRSRGAAWYASKADAWDVVQACPQQVSCKRHPQGCTEAATSIGDHDNTT